MVHTEENAFQAQKRLVFEFFKLAPFRQRVLRTLTSRLMGVLSWMSAIFSSETETQFPLLVNYFIMLSLTLDEGRANWALQTTWELVALKSSDVA